MWRWIDRIDGWMAGWIEWIAWMLLTDHKAVTCRRKSMWPRFGSVGSLVQYLFYIVLIHGNLLKKMYIDCYFGRHYNKINNNKLFMFIMMDMEWSIVLNLEI